MLTKFELNDIEAARCEEFQKKHKECKPQTNSLFPPNASYTFSFTPCGIGVVITITCPYCGETENVTDYDTW